MNIQPIESVDYITLHKVLTSSRLTEVEKTQFIKANKQQINRIIQNEITPSEFKGLMKGRPIQKFRPLKNSFTKRGDRILLSKSLSIPVSDVDDYINEVTENIQTIDKIDFLSPDKMDALKTYVYRHGSKEQLVTFLDYELRSSKDKLKTLYSTLNYYSGGVADYFIRPIHRFDNNTLIRIYNVIDKNITAAQKEGLVGEKESGEISRWALVQIYKIQNNNKLINAVKTAKILK